MNFSGRIRHDRTGEPSKSPVYGRVRIPPLLSENTAAMNRIAILFLLCVLPLLSSYAAEDVAKELKLPFLDLHQISIAHHNQIGPEASMTYNFKEGDLTHFNRKGAEASAGLILEELKTVLPDVASYVKVAGPAEQRAAGLPVTQPRLKGEREAQAVML